MEIDAARLKALDQMLAREQIRQCLVRYTRGIDRHDAALVASAYHADGEDEHGLGREVASHASSVHDTIWEAHQHFLTNITIDLDGDTAHAESYFLVAGRRKQNSATDIHGGRYVDRFERRDGQWAITDRIRIYEWGFPAEQAVESLKSFRLGAHDTSDLSFTRPLRVRPK